MGGERERCSSCFTSPLMIKPLSQSCRQPDCGVFSFFFFSFGGERGGMLCVLVVVENTKRANLRGFGTNTSGLLYYIVDSLNECL